METITEKETREKITPYAFKVDATLLGVPLSSPSRRGFALLIDLIIVSLLSVLPGDLLALMLTGLSVSAMRKSWQQSVSKKGGYIYMSLAALCILAALAIFTQRLDDLVDPPDQVSVQVLAEEESQGETGIQHEPDFSIVAWVIGSVQDLGLSFGWAALYFSVMLSRYKGQTIGKRILGIRVIRLDGNPLSLWNSFERYGGYGAGIATGLLGFIQIYWDPNRQAIHDKISGTVVIKE